ncbi:hypothetical protein BDF19DRAFT_471626 [Syncephalis fuscata]|nr:hypothetical protein BDF19DRAFT_471626 [Syncephalis fuscata]
MTAGRLKDLVRDDHYVKVAGIDIDGILRGKLMSKKKFLSILDDGFGFCSVVFGWDLHDRTYSEATSISNTENGYGDVLARIDLNSYRHFLNPETQEPLSVCPRSLLKRVVNDLNELGFEPMCGAEFEFFQFDETPNTLAKKDFRNLSPLTPGMFGYSLLRPTLKQDYFYSLIEQCRLFDVPLEALHTETGPGVYEVAIEYASAMKMADYAQLFKTSAKQIGLLNGVITSFMAKPYGDQPGCSGHLHFSLRDITTGMNVFAVTESDEAKEGDCTHMSATMQHFLAGMLAGLPSILAILAPTVNSYKRLVANYWAPVVVTWGRENRTAAVRAITVPSCSPSGTRLEMRVSGADINAHLAIAACLACGLYGIKEKLPLPSPVSGDVTQDATVERLARDLRTATETFADENSIARKVLGDEFVDHYAATRRNEWSLWSDAVTDWELRRYLELV